MASSNSLEKHKTAASELRKLSLDNVNLFDLLGLKHDLSPKSGCNGPSLSTWVHLIREDGEQKEKGKKKKKTAPYHIQGLQKSLDNRYNHLVESRPDEDRLLRLNNAREYFKVHCALRFSYWATERSRTDGSASWGHCYHQKCNNTAPTEEYWIEGEVAPEPLSKPGEADALADDAISISSDDSFQAETRQQSNLNDTALLCLCKRLFHNVQSLLEHGRHCETVPESARAKSDRICQGECVYRCVMKAGTTKSWKHRNKEHYSCQHCGQITTKGSGHYSARHTLIDPVDYFLKPRKEFQKRKPDQVLKKIFESLSPCEAKDLNGLDDARILSVCRSSLKRCAALAFTSSDSPALKNDDLKSHQNATATYIDPRNDTENWNNAERVLENNAPVSRLQQGSRISPDSPAADHSECAIFEPMEIVDQPPATSPVQLPSPSFSLPGDGQVSRRSAPALPPEDDIQDPSFDLCTCEDERPQPLHSSNDSLSNGSGAPPHPARPDTTSNAEPLPSCAAARTTTDRSPTTEIDKRRPGQDATEDHGGAVIISKNSASVSSWQQDPLSAVNCPTPIDINYALLEHTEGSRSTSVENPSTASPSPPTSLSGYDIDMALRLPSPHADNSHDISEPPDYEDGCSPPVNSGDPTGLDMAFSQKPSAIDSGVESAGTDNSITASQVSLVSTSGGTAFSRKRPIGDVDTESSGIKAKRARLVQGSPAEGLASAMGVTQGDEVEDNTILVPSLESSDHRHALQSNITRALEFAADCPTDHTPAENAGSAGGTVARGTEVSTTGPFTLVPSAYSTEPLSRYQLSTDSCQATTFSQYTHPTTQEVNSVCQYENMSPFVPVSIATAGHASDLVDCGQEISVFGNSQCVSKDDTPTKHNIPEDIDAEIKRICDKNNLQPSVTGRYRNNSIIWRIDSQKGLSELAKSPKYQYEDAIFVKAQGYSCLTFYPEDISKLIDCAKDVIQDDPIHVPPGRRCSINPEQGISHISTSCTFKKRASLVIWEDGKRFLTFILDDEKGGGLLGLSKSGWYEELPSQPI